jgi:hypothetical protein
MVSFCTGLAGDENLNKMRNRFGRTFHMAVGGAVAAVAMVALVALRPARRRAKREATESGAPAQDVG